MPDPDSWPMAAIKLDNVTKVFANGHVAVRGLSLEIADGTLVALVGPSGCGKTTILRMVAGLETPTHGRIYIGDQDVTHRPPRERDVAMVFQNYALYPDKTVRANLEFGLRLQGALPERIANRVTEAARMLAIEPLLDRRPTELSGGQRQRVALGRALVRQPRAFLLDEPLSNLDAQLRMQTRLELARLRRRLAATMLYVTHDQEEALALGDQVAVLREGVLQQTAAPAEIYRRPANAFVGGFIGEPAMSFFRCLLRRADGTATMEAPFFTLSLSGNAPPSTHDGKVLLGVRPQDIHRVNPTEADTTARVEMIQPLGGEMLVHLHLTAAAEEMRITLRLPAEKRVEQDERLGLRFVRDQLHLFDATTGKRLN